MEEKIQKKMRKQEKKNQKKFWLQAIKREESKGKNN